MRKLQLQISQPSNDCTTPLGLSVEGPNTKSFGRFKSHNSFSSTYCPHENPHSPWRSMVGRFNWGPESLKINGAFQYESPFPEVYFQGRKTLVSGSCMISWGKDLPCLARYNPRFSTDFPRVPGILSAMWHPKVYVKSKGVLKRWWFNDLCVGCKLVLIISR